MSVQKIQMLVRLFSTHWLAPWYNKLECLPRHWLAFSSEQHGFKLVHNLFMEAKKWNGTLCLVQIRAHRGQHCEGKQNKILKKKIYGSINAVKLFYIYKIEIALSYWKK